MPIYKLVDELIFPSVEEAENGIVAVGGDLSPERLMLAYKSGIFPWFSEDEPIVWWSPDPRFVLFPEKLHISRSLKRLMTQQRYHVTFNRDFEGVIANCREMVRQGQQGTWITKEMKKAYINLFNLGFAQSIEVWKGEELVGGMYGVTLGTIFCGESMFSKESNTSKIALVSFMKKFQEEGGRLLDCQVHSDHMQRMGAEKISRKDFMMFIETA